jgi:hypothetical protein
MGSTAGAESDEIPLLTTEDLISLIYLIKGAEWLS